MGCRLCNMKYVGKTKTTFNIRLNNHRNYIKNSRAILPCRNFQQHSYDFDKHAKFLSIVNTSNPKDNLDQRLIR